MQIWDTQVISEEGITFKNISIGDHCTIGQRTVLLPGCTLKEHVTCGSESILLRDTVVEAKGTVVGNPPTIFFSSVDDSFAGAYFGFIPSTLLILCHYPSIFQSMPSEANPFLFVYLIVI